MRATLLADGTLRCAGRTCRAAFGKGGITAEKREGDGATPAGIHPIRQVFYRADRVAKPLAAVPVEPLAPGDAWCDDQTRPEYNRRIILPHPARHDALWRTDALYDVVGVLGWNDAPVQNGRGSAIFLHLARPDHAPTEGCIALALPDLLTVLPGLTEIEVAI